MLICYVTPKTIKLEGCIATVLKRVFRDNFVIFRRRSKRIAFLESVNVLTMQIFNFRDGHVTTFRHPSGACNDSRRRMRMMETVQ